MILVAVSCSITLVVVITGVGALPDRFSVLKLAKETNLDRLFVLVATAGDAGAGVGVGDLSEGARVGDGDGSGDGEKVPVKGTVLT